MYKLRIKYTKAAQAMFLSSRDELRILEKAIIRIGLNIYYDSTGQPSITPAISEFEKIESTCEICDVTISGFPDISYVIRAMNNTLPTGMVIMSAECIAEDSSLISDIVYAAVYEIMPEFENLDEMTRRQEDDLFTWYRETLNKYLSEPTILVLIKSLERNERIDIKPRILDYEILINHGLRVIVETNKNYIFNPVYIMDGFMEYIQKEIKYNIKRTNILYNK